MRNEFYKLFKPIKRNRLAIDCIPHKENNKSANICDNLNEYVNSPYAEEKFLKYLDVKACYELTSYNKTKAIQVIETVKEYLKGFYA
ncbi:29273_t:CDS:2, partial [Gigaspora margarita]